MSWFESRPLFGTRLLVTRPREQAGELRQRLADLGAWVDVQPAIRIGDPPDWRPVDAALRQLNSYDWLVFSSANGVRFFLDRLLDRHGDLRRLGAVRLAAIGPGTAAALGRYHLRADLVPGRYRAEELARELAEEASSSRFLLLRASRGREVLAEQLAAAGGRVDQIVVYSSTDVETPDPQIAEALAAGRIDWVTVTSSAIAESLVRLFGDDLRRARLASISPVTSEALRGLGYEPKVEAVVYTMDGLVDALLNSAQARGVSPTAGPSDKSTKV
jgi:uroporphyrinogen III methyltransferase/synthase